MPWTVLRNVHGLLRGVSSPGVIVAIKQALALDGRNGVLFGDIGCYALGILPTGFSQLKTVHAMGSGAGMACGFGNFSPVWGASAKSSRLRRFHFFPCCDSVLVNAVHHSSRFLLIVLDNNATAMTGFHPIREAR